MNEKTEKALQQMPVITKIVNADIGELDKYYILKWYIGGWRDEAWEEDGIICFEVDKEN